MTDLTATEKRRLATREIWFRFGDSLIRADVREALERRGFRAHITSLNPADIRIIIEDVSPEDFLAACRFCDENDGEEIDRP